MSTRDIIEQAKKLLSDKAWEEIAKKTYQDALVYGFGAISASPDYSGQIKIEKRVSIFKRTEEKLYSSILNKYINPETGEVVED